MYAMEYYWAIKRNGTGSFIVMRMNPRGKTEKNKYCILDIYVNPSHIFCPQPFHRISLKQDVPSLSLYQPPVSTACPSCLNGSSQKGPYSFPHVWKCLLFTHLPRNQHNTSQRHAKYKIRKKDAGIFLKPGAKCSELLKETTYYGSATS